MSGSLKKSAKRVQQVVSNLGYEFQIVELDDSTRTAKDAADAIGCTVAQIAKSLIFKTNESQQPILVITSGSNQVDEKLIDAILGEKIGKANADFVLTTTGFAIGGVPPVGHSVRIRTLIDADLFEHEAIWAAAGTPHAVFKLTPAALLDMTGGKVIAVH
ncbi:MAG: YbaK/EbsC family protein [Anaerolineales bacterium]|nr:YbaK/EbsC family protein [Anaerolineales bacterium]